MTADPSTVCPYLWENLHSAFFPWPVALLVRFEETRSASNSDTATRDASLQSNSRRYLIRFSAIVLAEGLFRTLMPYRPRFLKMCSSCCQKNACEDTDFHGCPAPRQLGRVS